MILRYTILWTYLADRCTHSSPTGANEKGELFVFRSSLFARIFRPQHVQVQVPSSLYSDALLPSRAALEINAAAMRHSPTSPLSSSCTHLSLSFTAPGNDQGGKKTLPKDDGPNLPRMSCSFFTPYRSRDNGVFSLAPHVRITLSYFFWCSQLA